MKVVLFCGGLGLRLRSGPDAVPKPLVTVGREPILLHVMRYYAHHGHREFILCLGHGGDAIRAYFRDHDVARHWRVTLVDTGVDSNIGQRLVMARRYVECDDAFLANYADGLTDLHLPDLIAAFHASGKIGACLCIAPPLSYHFVRVGADGTVVEIADPRQLELRVNGGYFVFRRAVFDYIADGDDLVAESFRKLVSDGRLLGYRHDGFWRSMDTFKDKHALDGLCASRNAPWEVWRSPTSAQVV